jgi:hypothetical protein
MTAVYMRYNSLCICSNRYEMDINFFIVAVPKLDLASCLSLCKYFNDMRIYKL